MKIVRSKELIKPTLIEIIRAEGPTKLCGKVQTATSWAEADAILHKNSTTAPNCGGYDKHDFKVTFADGTTYSGRYDLQHWKVERPDLAGHVRSFIRYLAGQPPAWMTGREDVLASYRKDREANAEQVAEAKHWLETYDVEQGNPV